MDATWMDGWMKKSIDGVQKRVGKPKNQTESDSSRAFIHAWPKSVSPRRAWNLSDPQQPFPQKTAQLDFLPAVKQVVRVDGLMDGV